MSLPTIFEICEPRADVIRGTIQESDFAADLKQVITGEARTRRYSLPTPTRPRGSKTSS
jgi:hypothetical protein